MCHCRSSEEQMKPAIEKKYRLADFFNAYWDEYCKHPAKFIESWQYKAVNAIRVCRTALLGIDYYACPQCGEVSEILHNCNNRFCPTCSWLDTVKWAERIKAQLLNIPHRHAVFTIPHQLIPLIERNRWAIYNMIGRVSADTMKDWITSKYNLQTGIVSVLHTFGEKKNLHLHTHMIVAWGGIDLKTGELKTIENDYVRFTFLQNKFRCKFEDELIALFDKNELDHQFTNRIEFMQFIKSINEHNWQVHLEPPMLTVEEVIRYIGRYSKRTCLSEYKITNIEGEYLTFEYKDYKDREDVLNPKSKAKEKLYRLHYRDFFPLLLQHVPLPNFKLVKYYGCYAHFKKIPQQYKAIQEEKPLSVQLMDEYQISDKNPKYCVGCTCAKEYINTVIDIRPKSQSHEPFDIAKHQHLVYKKIFLENTHKIMKKTA